MSPFTQLLFLFVGTVTHKSFCHRKIKTISRLTKSKFFLHFLVNKYIISHRFYFQLTLPKAFLSTLNDFFFCILCSLNAFPPEGLSRSVNFDFFFSALNISTQINTQHKQVVLKTHTFFHVQGRKQSVACTPAYSSIITKKKLIRHEKSSYRLTVETHHPKLQDQNKKK